MAKRINALAAIILAVFLLPISQAATTHKSTKNSKATLHRASVSRSSSAHPGKKTRSRKLHGQQAIEPVRVTQIQQALINAHYLTGEADGNWDANTIAAMQKFQADNNWQTKLMPDARALIKLGLGPDYSAAINAKDTSYTATPTAATDSSTQQTTGFESASGISR